MTDAAQPKTARRTPRRPYGLDRPLESWLHADDYRRAAAAACVCQHGGAFCMADGYCHYGGRCFGRTHDEAVVAEIACVKDDLRRGKLTLDDGLARLAFWMDERDRPTERECPAHVDLARSFFSPDPARSFFHPDPDA